MSCRPRYCGDLEFVNPLAAILVAINIALGINGNAVRLVERPGEIRAAEACLGMAKRAPPNQFCRKMLGFWKSCRVKEEIRRVKSTQFLRQLSENHHRAS